MEQENFKDLEALCVSIQNNLVHGTSLRHQHFEALSMHGIIYSREPKLGQLYHVNM